MSPLFLVSWSIRKLMVVPVLLLQVKVVYVRNLPDSATEEQLQKLFERHGEVTKVVLPSSKPGQAKRDFGFVHFTDRAHALKAIEKTEVYELEGQMKWEFESKPLFYSYCLSLCYFHHFNNLSFAVTHYVGVSYF